MYKISYTGDGAQTEFLFAFPFFQDCDINVFIDDKAQTDQQYSVIANDNFDGGTIVFTDAPAVGTRIDILRKVMLKRVVDYQPTAPIDPEDLNTDFNQLMAAMNEIDTINIDLVQWANIHERTLAFLDYNMQVIQDKMSGGGVMGLYKNLMSILECAIPNLINDYGTIEPSTGNEECDDYGLL